MSKMISDDLIEKTKVIRNTLLKVIIWSLVVIVVICVMYILSGSDLDGVFAKFLGTIGIFTLASAVCANNFKQLESEYKSAQMMAFSGVFLNIVWCILWILAAWGVFDIYGECNKTSSYFSVCLNWGYSLFGIFTLTASYLSFLCFMGSNIMGLQDGGKASMLKPLKITTVSLLAYDMIYEIVCVICSPAHDDSGDNRFYTLSLFARGIWILLALVAWIVSRVYKREKAEASGSEEKIISTEVIGNADPIPNPHAFDHINGDSGGNSFDEDAYRREVEERIRKEMIEKEIREKLEKEAAEKNQ